MSNTISSNSITIIIVLYKESYDLISNTLNKIENFKKIIIDNDGNDLLKKKNSIKVFDRSICFK